MLPTAKVVVSVLLAVLLALVAAAVVELVTLVVLQAVATLSPSVCLTSGAFVGDI